MTSLSRLSEADPKTLVAADYNPRGIGEEAFEALKGSLRQFGFIDPAIVNSRTGKLVGGHQRVRAAIELNMDKVPVVWIDVDETTEKAINVTLNNYKIGGFYTDNLKVLLDELTVSLPVGQFVEVGLDKLVAFEDWSEEDLPKDPPEEKAPEAVVKLRCPLEMEGLLREVVVGAIRARGLDEVSVD